MKKGQVTSTFSPKLDSNSKAQYIPTADMAATLATISDVSALKKKAATDETDLAKLKTDIAAVKKKKLSWCLLFICW